MTVCLVRIGHSGNKEHDMNWGLPFSDETIKEMVGRTMVLSDHNPLQTMFRTIMNTPVQSGGDFPRGRFEVVDGILNMIDSQGLFCEFAGTETRNGIVYAVGKSVQTTSVNGADRITMHEKTPLPKGKFGICISSNARYYRTTLPMLLESIRKARVDMSSVVAVVGGLGSDKMSIMDGDTMEGAKIVYRQEDGFGFNGLLAANGDFPYWLLLHDTCEMERSFADLSGDVDIGLAPDVIRLRKIENDWTGFYRTGFLDRIRPQITDRLDSIGEIIKNSVRVVTHVPGNIVEAGVKDVYGKGNRRVIEKLPIGIRKYRAVSGRRTL